MRKLALLSTKAFVFGVVVVHAQAPLVGSSMSPKEVVEQLWSLATQGELLTSQGWNRASRLFTEPNPPSQNKVIIVMSNYWAVERSTTKENTAEVIVQFEELGRIDSSLHFVSTPEDKREVRTGMLYHLVFAGTHSPMFKADGKTIDRQVPGPVEWRIKGPQELPWATVNAAIRYVLEARSKTTDASVKSNSDRTLAALLQLH